MQPPAQYGAAAGGDALPGGNLADSHSGDRARLSWNDCGSPDASVRLVGCPPQEAPRLERTLVAHRLSRLRQPVFGVAAVTWPLGMKNDSSVPAVRRACSFPIPCNVTS